MAPAFALYVEDILLREDITRDIVSVEVEDTVDVAGMITIEVANASHRYTDARLFGPGNEVEVHMGYGTALGFVGRGEFVRHNPRFPRAEFPTLSIKAYDRSHRMMRQELELQGEKSSTPRKAKKESGQPFDAPLGNVVKFLLRKYAIAAIVDPAIASKPVKFIQKKGTSDYEILRALANVEDCEFWVSFDPKLKLWVGNFRKIPRNGETRQDKTYTFRYGDGARSTLLDFDPEFALPAAVSEVQAWVWNPKAKEWALVNVEETKAGKSPKFSAATAADPKAPPGGTADPLDSMTRVKIAANGHSVVVLTRPFRDQAEAAAYVKGWIERHKDAFVVARGTIPGIETIRAGQVHRFEGVGVRYSGDYYLSTVRHKWTPGDGYLCEFAARKVIQ